MKQEKVLIDGIPSIVYGEKTDQVYLFVHGQSGYKEEAESFAEIVLQNGWQVLSVDLPEHGERKDETNRFFPWIVEPELQRIWTYMEVRWKRIALRANSIGAWYSMLALRDKNIVKSLFVSPILDMKHHHMMSWADVTEDLLEASKTISTSFGQTLSWEYLLFAKQHPIKIWNSETHILYGRKDGLTERSIVDDFVKRFHCDLMIMESGEHWFHTKEQIAVLKGWVKRNSS